MKKFRMQRYSNCEPGTLLVHTSIALGRGEPRAEIERTHLETFITASQKCLMNLIINIRGLVTGFLFYFFPSIHFYCIYKDIKL